MKGSRTREPCHPSQSFGSARAKPLCAHPDRPFARRGVTSDPRVFPVWVGKNHDRRWAAINRALRTRLHSPSGDALRTVATNELHLSRSSIWSTLFIFSSPLNSTG